MQVPAVLPVRILINVLLAAGAAGCELVGDIFQAGMAVGAIAVVLVVVLIGWLVAKARG
jgi:hypothetical protein